MTRPTRPNLDALREDAEICISRLEDGEIDQQLAKAAAQCINQLKSIVFPISDLRVDLNTNTCHRGDHQRKLTRSQAPLLFTLNKHYPEVVTFGVLSKALYGAQPPETDSALKFMICTLRQRIAILGIDIRNVGGVGYHLALSAPPRAAIEDDGVEDEQAVA